MKAKQLVEKMGQRLIGRFVWTDPYGEWPGGPAEVIEIDPDPDSGIAFQVRSLTKEQQQCSPDIGVMDHERILLFNKHPG